MSEAYISNENHIKLVDSDKRVVAVFVPEDKEYVNALCGDVYNVISWELDKTPYEVEFHSHSYIKWDGCSHFRFYGEDYTNKNGMEEKMEAYYHLCGSLSIIEHMRLIVFAFELMVHKVGDKVLGEELKSYEHLKALGLLNGYEIVAK